MKRRTKWAVGLTVVVVTIAIVVDLAPDFSDNPHFTPEFIRELTKDLIDMVVCFLTLLWMIWYWLGRREAKGPDQREKRGRSEF